jgi:hypothetical protein
MAIAAGDDGCSEVYVCTQEQDRVKREWERLREGKD